MKPVFSIPLLACLALIDAASLHAADFPPYDGTAERDAFWEFHNKRVLEQLQTQEKQLADELAKTTDAGAKGALQSELDHVRTRLTKPQFFTFATPADLPGDLVWENGLSEPEIGDPQAKKGGTFNSYIPSFPPTIRTLGENSNNAFRGYHYDDIELSFVGLHPETGAVIPGLAKEWAISPDSRTVYFRIDPDARYSDGVPVEADDWFNTFYMQLSEYPQNPFGNEWYATQYTNITRYDSHTLSVTLAEAKALAPYWTSLVPMPRHFYKEFGPDFESRYQWRPRPTTGAYAILEGDVKFGRSVTLTRVKDWWARDKPFNRYRYNPDRLVYRVVRLPEKALELFFQGSLDTFLVGDPTHWYERLEIPALHNGYLHKAKFYNVWPSSSAGLYLNTAVAPLNNRDVRIGLSHAMNYQKVIDFDLRGDYRRLNAFSEGYPLLGNPPITAREFSPEKARAAFATAGFSKAGPDGVLVNDKGERLVITITHRKSPVIDKYMARLREEALKCGLELRLESMDGSAAFQKASQKQHQVVQVAFGTTPPFPDHYQHFHSKDAYLEDGKTPRPNTNNLTSFADPRMDALCEAQRKATTVEEYKRTVFEADQIVHDEAIWIPSFDQNFYWVAYWRWVKWPPGFNVAISQDPYQNHVLWIDEAARAETLEAMRSGKTFPEIDEVYDQNLKSLSQNGGAR
ncbi:MAG: ABC transporter substrate-binding protein [Verrucomicrobiales bacterium]|nr:ABC transporter substrate-binding protein [Verrucomicrobiales bacterium]